MSLSRIPSVRLLYCLAASLLLTSCASAPPTPSSGAGPADRAEQALAAGQILDAARAWEQASESAPEPERSLYLLRAAEAWAAAGRHDPARQATERLDRNRLGGPDRSRLALLQAEQALLAGDAEAAAFHLETAQDNLPPGQTARYRALEDSLERLMANPAGNLLARIARDLVSVRIADPEQATRLLLALEDVSSDLLAQAATAGSGSPAGIWAELVLRARHSAMAPESLPESAQRWAIDFPGHAIDEGGFSATVDAYARAHPAPRQVAVLVPTTGNLASAGTAIRDGVLSAFFEHPSTTTLRFYEPGDTPEEAIAAYRRAVQDGADWVVGPVRKESVDALARLPDATVPILLLNEVADTAATGHFSLSLSQEEEARAIAARMLKHGIQRTVTLSADNTWGNRMDSAFSQAYLAGGGEIAAAARFPVDESDHSALITRTLEIDQSQDRKNRLQSILGKTLQFEPHLRQDFDGFFLSATVEQARQLKPQLKFHEAGDLPVYASSRVYSGIPDRSADQDLNGVVVPLTRVQLDVSQGARLPGLESVRRGSLVNLYALGEDAWSVLRWLPLLQKDASLVFPGASGSLRLEPSGHLAREPSWAVFSGGRPMAVQDESLLEQGS